MLDEEGLCNLTKQKRPHYRCMKPWYVWDAKCLASCHIWGLAEHIVHLSNIKQNEVFRPQKKKKQHKIVKHMPTHMLVFFRDFVNAYPSCFTKQDNKDKIIIIIITIISKWGGHV